MNEPLLLAIDNGTQSVRALLFDTEGQLLAKSQVPIEAYFLREPGCAEQDPGYFWQSLCAACRELWDQPGVGPSPRRPGAPCRPASDPRPQSYRL